LSSLLGFSLILLSEKLLEELLSSDEFDNRVFFIGLEDPTFLFSSFFEESFYLIFQRLFSLRLFFS